MTPSTPTRTEYLERLRDLLPARDTARILREVDGLLQDRMDAEEAEPGVDAGEAERRAQMALGAPEELAEQLVTVPIRVDLGTRRLFVRLLAVLFATHLVLSIVLTAAAGTRAVLPGLLGPLPKEPLAAVFSGALSILLIDTGALFLVFALLGRGKTPSGLPELRLRTRASRRDAVLGLVLLGLVALILHPFRDQIFAVRVEDRLVGFLTGDLVAVLPIVDAALGLFALQQLLVLWRGRETAAGVAADALASLVLAGALLFAATRTELVHFPDAALGRAGAAALDDLVTRLLLLLCVLGALFMVVRFVKRCFRVRQLIVAN